MITELTMPSLSPTMEEGTLVAWHVKKGDKLEAGQVVAEVQTDKAVVEWESLDEGYIAEILIEEGSEAKVNAVAALLASKEGEDLGDAVDKAKAKNAELASSGGDDDDDDNSDDDDSDDDQGKSDGKKSAGKKAGKDKGKDKDEDPAPPPMPSRPKASAPTSSNLAKGKRASPVAVRLATKNGLDLNLIEGTGPDGRIIKVDVEKAVASGSARPAAPSGGPAPKPKRPLTRKDGKDEQVAISKMRQVIGRRLLQSKTEIPHFYVTERINAGPMVTLRAQLTAFAGVKVTFNDLVLKACALTLRQHPVVNSTFNGKKFTKHDSADISVAVAIPDGLITPIVKGAHALSVAEISSTVRSLAEKAKEGSLKPEEFEGGSFTISNLGMYGIEEFNAIINPPQCAIIAVGGIKEEALVVDGQVVAGQTMRVTLSCDHRVVDGADAAAFLRDLRELLERPAALLL